MKKDIPRSRSVQMALVRSKNTKPEWIVRRLVHSLGFRYRLHCKDLVGTPDLVFRTRRKVIFVHGCFWHCHSDANCWRSRLPKTRLEFWKPKLTANVTRDQKVKGTLEKQGWEVLIVWECQTVAGQRSQLTSMLAAFLNQATSSDEV